MLSHISNDTIKLVKNREKNWTKTNIRKQCYGREIKEEKEMIKEDKRRQPQNQALCVHSYESKYKLNSNSKFRNIRPKANEKHLFHEFEYCKRHSKLDQVYCAWLIKWVVKWEIIQLAELCLTRWWIISGTWWYWVSIWQYWLVLG